MCRLTFRLTGFLLLFCAFGSLEAQTVIRGQVVDGETGDPVFAAGVLVQGSTMGTSTDFDGRFRLEVASLPVTLNVSFIGYATLAIDVRDASRMRSAPCCSPMPSSWRRLRLWGRGSTSARSKVR